MPYRPGVQYDASPLFQGMSGFGNSIFNAADANQREKVQREELKQRGDISKLQLEIEKERVRLQQKAIDARTAEGAADRSVRVAEGNADRTQRAQEQESRRTHEEKMAVADFLSAKPQPLQGNGLSGYFFSPKTGQIIAPKTPEVRANPQKPPIVSPDGKFWYNEKDGEWIQVKEKGESLADILNPNRDKTAAPSTAPAAPAASARTPAPGASKYIPGRVYPGKNGTKARYNPDGTWTPVP